MKQIYRNGRFYWVNDDGSPSSMNTPLNPGIGVRREEDILSRLPDAELAGFRGPGAVPFGMAQSRRDSSNYPDPVPTFRPLAGNQENNRGAEVIMDPSTIQPSPVSGGGVVTGPWRLIVQNDKNSGEDAESICISLGRRVVNQVAPNAMDISIMENQYQCLLEWGIGGANFSAILDWDNGRNLTIPASFVRVSVRQLLLKRAPLEILPAVEAFSCGFGYGVEGHRNCPRLTFPISDTRGGTPSSGVLPPGSTVDLVEIPQFATHIGLLVKEQVLSAATDLYLGVNFHKTVSGSPGSGCIYNRLSNLQSDNLIPIPNGTQFISLLNLNAVGIYVDGFWGLSL
jgi:hypothetical protein